MPTNLTEGWITHNGAPCPVDPDATVIVRYRADPSDFDFSQYRRFRAGDVVWGHFPSAAASDVIAYKPESSNADR